MSMLIAGLVVFLGVHLVPVSQGLRDRLRQALGDTGYKLAFSAVSAIGFGLIVYGYGRMQSGGAENPLLRVPPTWTRHLLWALMLPALILVVAAYTPSRIRDRVGHPMLIGTLIWAGGHFIANGTMAATLLFGSFFVWAAVDLVSARRRHARGPLGDAAGTMGGDIAALVIGTALYAALLFGGHALLIGPHLLR